MIPPIVGVPALAWWPSGPSSRMCWPNSRVAQELDELRAQEDADEQRGRAARSGPRPSGVGQRLRADDASRPTPREALTSTGVAGAQQLRAERARPSAASATEWSRRRSRAPSRRASGPTVTSTSSRARARARRSRAWKRDLVGPELEHVAEHRDAARRRARGEVVEGGAHRHRVGVVAVVDDDRPRPAARRAAPRSAESVDVDAARAARRRAPRAAATAASALWRMWALESNGIRDVDSRPPSRQQRTSPPWPNVTVSTGRRGGGARAAARRPGRPPCRPARSPAISSALAAAIASSEPSSSRCTGPTLTITPDVGLGDRGQLGDLAGAAHRHLEHEHLGAGRRREDRQRQRRSRC